MCLYFGIYAFMSPLPCSDIKLTQTFINKQKRNYLPEGGF